jgi:hypothetical protein
MNDSYPKGVYIVAVDMGYGHQRAAFPLLKMAAVPRAWNTAPHIISANEYPDIPRKDKLIWSGIRKTYEGVSRFDSLPFLGKRIFHLMDYFHQPTLEVKEIYSTIHRGDLGKHLIKTLGANPLPLICTFPIPAFCAEEHGYIGEIYCLCTDTDVARAWAPLHPERSRIIYLAPTVRVKERLKLYGVRAENIVITGFPLPEVPTDPAIARVALDRRIMVLDPRTRYRKKYGGLLDLYVNGTPSGRVGRDIPVGPKMPVTILFSVGGAGAQWEVGVALLESLKQHIQSAHIRLIMAVGVSKKIKEVFEATMKRLGIRIEQNILYAPNRFEYFKKFNEVLSETDILWTKPSELSFYAGLGLPIIMTSPLGSQEESNQAWLHMVGAGIEQNDPRYAHEWLMDWLESGWLAGAAVNGLLNAPKKAVQHIEDLVIHGRRVEIEDIHFL